MDHSSDVVSFFFPNKTRKHDAKCTSLYSSSILADFDELMKHIHCQICSYYNLIMLHLVFSWKCIVTATLHFFKKEMNEHRVILILTVNTCLKNTILLIIKWSRQHLYCNSLIGAKLLLLIFLAFDFCLFCVVIRFFHPRHKGQWPPTSKDFLSQIVSITFIFLS